MNEQTIWNYCKQQGLTDAGAAGLMGNLKAESNLNSQNLQDSYEKKLGYTDAAYTTAVDSGTYTNFVKDGAGYGLAQWTYYTRKQNLLNYCKQQKTSIGDLVAQLSFLFVELNSSYSQLIKTLKTTNSVQEASNAVLLQFEKPADQSASVQTKRYNYAQNFYNQYTTTKEVTTTGMKYNSSNKPLQCMMTNSTCYKGTSQMEIKGVLWHCTGANNPNLKRYVQPSDSDSNKNNLLQLIGTNTNANDWNHIDYQAGVNAWIGKLADGTVTTVQTLPWNYRPWGCGSGSKGSCNSGWIQFEICEDSLSDSTYFGKVYQEACELTAYLCTLYNINPKGSVSFNGVTVPTILCHQDSYKLGLGTNHSDVYNWFNNFGKTMDDVRNDVYNLMNNSSATAIAKEEEEVTQEQFNEMMDTYMAELATKPATWDESAMNWAQQNGIFVGNEKGETMPKKYMTRGELATVLQRVYEKLGK